MRSRRDEPTSGPGARMPAYRAPGAASFSVRLIGALLALAVAGPVRAAGERFVFIVNPASSLSSLTSEGLKALYLGKANSLESLRVTPINYKAGTPIRVAFERRVMGMEPQAVIKYWKSQRFLGFGDAQPISFGSVEAVRTYVSRQESALGYIPLSAVDETVRSVTTLDEKPLDPSASTYPLVFP